MSAPQPYIQPCRDVIENTIKTNHLEVQIDRQYIELHDISKTLSKIHTKMIFILAAILGSIISGIVVRFING
jgi:hypothetical protein